MLNQITNRLTIIGTDDQVNQIKNFLKGDDFEDGSPRLIDFDKIVPCPQVIKDAGEIICSIVDALKNRYMLSHENFLIKAYKETGYIHWYDWNRANWGTKWNAYNFNYSTPHNVIVWNTAGSNVIGLMEKLSLKFPDMEFLYDWADEVVGQNCGRSKIKNGVSWLNVPKNGSKKAYELSFELNPGEWKN